MIVAELFAKLGLVPDEKSWERGHELVEGLHHALEAYLGYEGLMKVKELVEGTVEAAVSAKHLGERLGISSDAVQELGYAADVTGASAEVMTQAMQRLAFGMENAKRGTGPLVTAMQQLHIPIANLRKESLDQNLEEIADGFAKAGPQVNKLALSIEIFGRNAGPRLLPLLEKGSSGIAELREEAQKLGVVIDEEGIEKAHEFEIAQKRLGATLTGVRNEAVIAMLPALQEMAEGLGEWVKENREAIASGLKAVLEGIAAAFHIVGEVLSVVVDIFQNHKEVVFALIAALGLLEAQAITTAIATAAAWVLSFAPLIIATGAVLALMMALKKLVEYVVGSTVSWRQMWDATVAGGEAVVDWLSELPGKVADFFGDVAQAIKDAFDEAWDYAVKKADAAWNAIKDSPIGRIGTALGEGAGYVTRKVIGGGENLDAIDSVSVAPSVPAGGVAGGDVNITGDTHITVDGAGSTNPDELAAKIKTAIDESNKDMLRQAHANISGGKR